MCVVLELGGLWVSLVVFEGCILLGLCYCFVVVDDLVVNEKIGNVIFVGINQFFIFNAGYENYCFVEGMVEQGMIYVFFVMIINVFFID